MSAFLCSPEHISAIVTARTHLDGSSVDWNDADTTRRARAAFAMLAAENAASVDYRYPRGPRAADALPEYAFVPVAFPTAYVGARATGHRLSDAGIPANVVPA